MWIATAENARKLDKAATEEYELTNESLMEMAGQTAATAVAELAGGGAVLVVCGTGNNGGDGLVLARILKLAGSPVKVYVAGSAKKLSELNKQMLAKARFAGVTVCFYGEDGWGDLGDDAADSEVIVDALLGTGQVGEPKGAVKEAIMTIRDAYATIVSLDVPSGIDADSGAADGVYLDADVTIGFGVAKPCYFQGVGAEACGDWQVEDIGYPDEVLQTFGNYLALDEPLVIEALGHRPVNSHKGNNGHVLVVAGSYQMRGAAVLAAQGALRAGAGRVTVASTVEVCDAVAACSPEAMLLPLEDDDGVISKTAVSQILDMADTVDCALFGPGLTTHESVRAFLQEVWEDWTLPAVIDADALNAISLGLKLPNVPCILTPHPGEMARLLGTSSEKLQHDRFGTVKAAVQKYQCTVLLKGAYSLIAGPESTLFVNTTGNPGMASSGTGDVLAGVVASLLVQGQATTNAAAIGAYLHGLAGDICAEESGPVGFLASDVASALAASRAKLEQWYQE